MNNISLLLISIWILVILYTVTQIKRSIGTLLDDINLLRDKFNVLKDSADTHNRLLNTVLIKDVKLIDDHIQHLTIKMNELYNKVDDTSDISSYGIYTRY